MTDIKPIRLIKYNRNYGCIAFLHNDSQSVITWSVVDVRRSPNPAYHKVAQTYRDPYVMTPFRFAPYTRGKKNDPGRKTTDGVEGRPCR